MARLFTHHDRLVLYHSPVSAAHDQAFPTSKSGTELDEETSAPSSHGFAVYIPHFHKIWGFLALLNIAMYITPLYDWAVPFLGKEKMARLSIIHVVLALSSFEFRIGRQRNGLYTIYREMQLHTIIFTLRSWVVILADWHFGFEDMLLRAPMVLVWHVLADVVTALYKPPSGESTIRRAVNGKTGYQDHGRLTHAALWFMSFAQLWGTYLLLTAMKTATRHSMCVMAPVQISAFLATLVRKGYCRSQTSVVIYVAVLLPAFYYHPWSVADAVFLLAAQVLRFQLRMNKYVMWVGLLLLTAWIRGDLFDFAAKVPQLSAVAPYLTTPQFIPRWCVTETWSPYVWAVATARSTAQSLGVLAM